MSALLSLPVGIEPVAGGYLVGGAVRDLLLGYAPHDYDWLVPDPAKAARNMADKVGGALVALDTQRGYWRAVLGRGADTIQHDFAPLPASVSSDLLRRDFTINALALDAAGHLLDPSGGLSDIQGRQVQMLSESNLRADPLRLLRAARLATTRDLHLEAATAQAIRRLAHAGLPLSAPERITAELQQLLTSPRAAVGVGLLQQLGLLELYLPELPAQHVTQSATQQMFAPLSQARVSAAASWAALLALLCAKGSHLCPLPPELLGRLRLPRAVSQRIERLLGALPMPPLTEAQARAFVHEHRQLLPELLLLDEGLQGPLSARSRERVAHAWQAQPVAPSPLLSAREAAALLSLSPGPTLGAALRALSLAQEVEPLTTPQQAREYLLGWAAEDK